MNSVLSDLLLLPFEKGGVLFPENEERILCWNTGVLGSLYSVHIIENYKYLDDSWLGKGITRQTPDKLSQSYDLVLTHLPQQKDYARFILAQSLQSLEDNGTLVAMAANDAGGKTIEKWFKELGLQPTNLSKNKCRIVWAQKQDVNQDRLDKYLQAGQQQKIKVGENEFVTQAGIYGWNKIDRGSKLLLENISNNLNGVGADFGCGYGFLSQSVLNQYPNIEKLYSIDADYNALQCAKENLNSYNDKVTYQWADITSPTFNLKNLDFIVMNPPFHQGKNTENSIGKNFITKAHQSLRNKGWIYMVCLLYTSPSPRDQRGSRMPSSA